MNSESERVLILAPSERDGAIAQEELRAEGITSAVMGSVEELCLAMREGAGAALLTEDGLTPASIALLKVTLAAQPEWSDFPLLVLGSRARHRERSNEALQSLGNVTLLDPPLRVRTLRRAAASALRARRRQYAAARAIAQRDQFLAMLGHELRNPLSTITLAVQVAGKRHPNPPSELNIVERQAQHLTRLVDDLLDLARITVGKLVLQQGNVDLAELTHRAAMFMAPRFASAGVALSIEGEPHGLVYGDPVRLEQVINNLLTNAVKYTPKGGAVRVSTKVVSDHVVVNISDTGVGISKELMGRLFEAFIQDDDTLARSQGGMGIGLTLVRNIVALHGGTVTAHSDGRGKGSVFEVRVPCLEHVASSSPVGVLAGQRDAASKPLSIVLIDDHADALELLAQALSELGHEVATATDGEAGLALIKRAQPQAAVIDLGLPGIDGFEVAARVRETFGAAIRLIALSGYGRPRDRQRAVSAGFDAHLVKPAIIDELVRTLAPGREWAR